MCNRIRVLVRAVVSVSFFSTAPVVGDADVYKSVDEEGNVTYQGQPVSGDAGNEMGMNAKTRIGSQSPGAGPSVVLYAIRGCSPCGKVRALLVKHRVPFQELNPVGDDTVAAELERITGSDEVPVLLVGDQAVTGFDEQAILDLLDDAGVDLRVGHASTRPRNRSLTREDLEAMSPEEIEQAARDALARGEDNDLFERDEGYFHGFGEEEKRGNDLR